jgi:hypothetical protein
MTAGWAKWLRRQPDPATRARQANQPAGHCRGPGAGSRTFHAWQYLSASGGESGSAVMFVTSVAWFASMRRAASADFSCGSAVSGYAARVP